MAVGLYKSDGINAAANEPVEVGTELDIGNAREGSGRVFRSVTKLQSGAEARLARVAWLADRRGLREATP